MVIIAQQSWETTFDMSQDFFSFPNLLIGLMRLSSSDQAVYDPKEIGRFVHQITGFEYRYAPPGTLESFGGSESSEEVATQQPEPSIPPALPTTLNIEDIGMQQPELSTHPSSLTILILQLQQVNQEYERKHMYSTPTMPAESTPNIEEIGMQQPELSTHPGSSMILNLQLQQANQEYERKHPYPTSTMPAESRKSSEEDEIKSFYSCVSDSHTSRGLFNQDNFDRFPQDSCIYTVNDASFKPSWSWVPYSHHKSAT